jgi:hypothetical protein
VFQPVELVKTAVTLPLKSASMRPPMLAPSQPASRPSSRKPKRDPRALMRKEPPESAWVPAFTRLALSLLLKGPPFQKAFTRTKPYGVTV